MAQYTDGRETRTIPDVLAGQYERRGWTRLDPPKVTVAPDPEPTVPAAEPEPQPRKGKRAKKSDPSDDFDTLGPGSVTDGLDD